MVVDQFEELFTLSTEAEQRAFLEALTHALAVPDSRLRVVATLRADYYDRPLGVQPFGALVQDATVTIPAMLPAEVEAAVVEPARRAGRTVERALAAELVGSMASEPAALPALQLMLFELADRSPDGTLSLAAYRALGGLEGAIAARAEGLYQSLDDPDREQVRSLFERLVVVGGEGEPTRRRASREELNVSTEILDRWTAARLLTLDVHPQTRVPTVEVAHEALVREWPRLRQWVEDDRSELIVLGRIRESAAAWADLDREPSALLRGTALEAALDVADRRTALAPLEAEFLEASRAARVAERAEQAELIRRQARTNRRLRCSWAASGSRWWWPSWVAWWRSTSGSKPTGNDTSRWPGSFPRRPTPTSATIRSAASCWRWPPWTQPDSTASRCCPRHWRLCIAGLRLPGSCAPSPGSAAPWTGARTASCSSPRAPRTPASSTSGTR